MNIGAVAGDPGTRRQIGDDAGEAVALIIGPGGGQGDNGASTPAHGGATDKIDHGTDPTAEEALDGIGDDLAGEVGEQGGIDGNHIAVAGDGNGIVGEVDGAKVDMRILV